MYYLLLRRDGQACHHMVLMWSKDVFLPLTIPGRCSSKFNDSLKVLYYLFWILLTVQIDWEVLVFVSDSERGSNTQRKKLSIEECVKKEKKQITLVTQIFPYRRLPKVPKNQTDSECNWGPRAENVAGWPRGPVAGRLPLCLPVTWWEEWKWRGSIFSNYLAPHWQKSGESDSGARLCQGSRFSRHRVTLASRVTVLSSDVVIWCLIFGKSTRSRFRVNLSYLKVSLCFSHIGNN